MEEKTIGEQVAERRRKLGLPEDGSKVEKHETLAELSESQVVVEEKPKKKSSKVAH